jgi:thiosulfate/3-mercaptopyruvate sulfurtransferase
MNRTLNSLLATLIGLAAIGAQAQVIVDATAVADAIARNALIWDVRPGSAFAKGHVPGAVNIGDAPAVLREPNTEDFIATAQVEKLLGAAGIDPAREIVIYGSRGGWQAYFGLYTLQYFGARNVRVFHDGLEGWTAANRPLAQGSGNATPVALKLSPDGASRVSVSTRDMVASLSRNDVQILDVRTPKEFSGEDIRAIRGGHIPGALNIPYEQNWVDPDTAAKLARRLT